MIRLYTWPTPNGRKVSILLEELGLPYSVHPVNTQDGSTKTPDFLMISPNGKIPAIVDPATGITLFESGAILIYLAERYGQFLPSDPVEKAQVLAWVMWQMGGLGPIAGQAHHYLHKAPGRAPYAEMRLHNELTRLYTTLDARLAGRAFICDTYSIADIACWPWVSRHARHQISLDAHPNVKAWYRRVLARPAVQAGYHVPQHMGVIPPG